MSYHFFLQGIFPTQGWNPCLLHWQVDSLPLSHLGSPISPLVLNKKCNLTKIVYYFKTIENHFIPSCFFLCSSFLTGPTVDFDPQIFSVGAFKRCYRNQTILLFFNLLWSYPSLSSSSVALKNNRLHSWCWMEQNKAGILSKHRSQRMSII